jgi:hypothetical protein
MKNVPVAKWPDVPLHGAYGPLYGRNDIGEPMPPEATLTPSADEPPAPEEVAPDVVPGEVNGEGSVEPS